MDLGIKELGFTLIIGAFAILGAEAILHYFFNRQLIGFFQGRIGLLEAGRSGGRKEGGERYESITLAFFIGLAFAVGILVENLSYNFIYVPKVAKETVLREDRRNNRVWTLVRDYEEDPNDQWWNAKDLARNGAFHLADPVVGKQVDNWILKADRCVPGSEVDSAAPNAVEFTAGDCPTRSNIKDSIEKLYYFAKNRVYLEQNYYDELTRIESRQAFARSLALTSFAYLIISAIGMMFLLVRLAHLILQGGRTRNAKLLWRRRTVQGLVTVGIFFLMCSSSLFIYDRESDEFNKRIYGYFSSMLIVEKLKEEKPRETATPAAASQPSPETKTEAAPRTSPSPEKR